MTTTAQPLFVDAHGATIRVDPPGPAETAYLKLTISKPTEYDDQSGSLVLGPSVMEIYINRSVAKEVSNALFVLADLDINKLMGIC